MNREYPPKPIVGVGVLVKKGDAYLLVKRASEPDKGFWTIPGGLVEIGETVRNAAMREVREETGLDVEIGEILDVIDKITSDSEGRTRYHFIVVDFIGYPRSGEMRPSSDALEARWVTKEEFGEYILTESFKQLLRHIGLDERV